MTPMEITLLVIGVIIFVISFFVKDFGDAKTEKEKELDQLEIRRMMERELDNMRSKVNDAVNETVEYSVDIAERSLEKVSNEKIMAVSEYSSTIMEEIDRSHKEVMFLYDMLSDKQTDLKNTVRKAEATVKEVESVSSEAVNTTEQLQRNLEMTSQNIVMSNDNLWDNSLLDGSSKMVDTITEEPKSDNESRIQPVFSQLKNDNGGIADDISLTSAPDIFKTIPSISKIMESADQTETKQPEIKEEKKKSGNFMRGFGTSTANSNQRIIELHDMGKSNVDIAKELGLGVGEVKLVIDLFKH